MRPGNVAALVVGCAAAGAAGGTLVAATPWTAAGWAAAAAWVTALIAGAAAWVGLRQLAETRQTREQTELLRREQVQPHVAVYMEPSPVDQVFIQLVVKNFGPTAAFDVTLSITPVLRRTSQNGPDEDLWLPESIPSLAPGQRWETFWDDSRERMTSTLPQRHDVEIEFRDSQGTRLHATAVLDWTQYQGRSWIETYSVHHVAKALRELSKTVRKWNEHPSRGGLAVWTRSGDERDATERAKYEKWKQSQQDGDPGSQVPGEE